MTINLRKITQGERGTLTFTWEFPEVITIPASISGAAITATMTDEDGLTTAVSGTLTGTAATTCTWALSAGDSGTAGTFTVLFKAVATGVTTYTLEATLEVIANPAVTGTQNEPLVSISATDAAWVTLAATAVPDGADVVDANDLGTAAYAATGDFDAAGAAAAAQAAAIAASLQKTSNLSDVASVPTARENLSIKIDPALSIRVIGDSIAAIADVAGLEAALNNVSASTLAIGGETSAQILNRVKGVSVIRPARTATLSGVTDLVIAENVPPRMINGAYSASWENYSNNQMVQIDSAAVYNHGNRVGTAKRRRYLAKCTYATDNNQLELWRGITPKSVVPEFSFEQYVDGTDVTTLPSFYSIARMTGAVSSLYAYTGQKSLEWTMGTSAGGARFLLRNGTQSIVLSANSIYEVSLRVYIPVAFAGGIDLELFAHPDIVRLNGTGNVPLDETGVWHWMNFLVRLSADGGVFLSLNLTAGDYGKKFYIDDVQVTEVYAKSTDTLVNTDTVYLNDITNSSGEMPSGISAYRRYYLSSAGVDATELSLTSGGAAVDLVENGYAELFENWHISWTPSAPDTTTHYLTAVAGSADYDAFALIWAGHNDVSGFDDTIGNIRATVGAWRNTHGDRFAVLTLVNSSAVGESFYHDQWERVRQWIMSEYPNNYVDTYQPAINWGLAQSPGSQAYIDAINKKVPDALLSDGVHQNSTGNTIMFTEPVTAFLIANGYAVAA